MIAVEELYAHLALELGDALGDRRLGRIEPCCGAAKAAEASGDKQKATTYFTELLRLTKNADTDRPEIGAAKQALAAR